MGPACAVADVRDGEATIWTSTQKPYDAGYCVAELLGLPRDKVRAIWMFGTGSYGRNDQGDAAGDAAVLSKHLGRPVRVQYMRHEGLAWDPKGTASVNRSRAGLDATGKVIAYENISKAFSRLDNNTRETRAADVLAGQLLGLPLNAGQSLRNSGRLLHVRPRAAGLGDHPAADGSRFAAAHRPICAILMARRSCSAASRSSTRWRPRPIPIRSISGCNI